MIDRISGFLMSKVKIFFGMIAMTILLIGVLSYLNIDWESSAPITKEKQESFLGTTNFVILAKILNRAKFDKNGKLANYEALQNEAKSADTILHFTSYEEIQSNKEFFDTFSEEEKQLLLEHYQHLNEPPFFVEYNEIIFRSLVIILGISIFLLVLLYYPIIIFAVIALIIFAEIMGMDIGFTLVAGSILILGLPFFLEKREIQESTIDKVSRSFNSSTSSFESFSSSSDSNGKTQDRAKKAQEKTKEVIKLIEGIREEGSIISTRRVSFKVSGEGAGNNAKYTVRKVNGIYEVRLGALLESEKPLATFDNSHQVLHFLQAEGSKKFKGTIIVEHTN